MVERSKKSKNLLEVYTELIEKENPDFKVLEELGKGAFGVCFMILS